MSDIWNEPPAHRPRSVRFPASIDARLVAMANGGMLSNVIIDLVWKGLNAGKAEAAPARPEANPLRALREAAGLSQAQAAARMGCTRGAWANAEKAAAVTPAMLERARKAFGGGK